MCSSKFYSTVCLCVLCSMCACKMSVRQFENVACRCVKSWSWSCLRTCRQTTSRQTLRCLNSEAHTGHCFSLSLSLFLSFSPSFTLPLSVSLSFPFSQMANAHSPRQHHPAADAINTGIKCTSLEYTYIISSYFQALRSIMQRYFIVTMPASSGWLKFCIRLT